MLLRGLPMAWKKMVIEFGMGTDIRGSDPTKAAVRALRDALWHNSLSIADVMGQNSDEMCIKVKIGVPDAEKVEHQEVLSVLPHGTGNIEVIEGGLKIPNDSGTDNTVIAHAAAIIYLDLPMED